MKTVQPKMKIHIEILFQWFEINYVDKNQDCLETKSESC